MSIVKFSPYRNSLFNQLVNDFFYDWEKSIAQTRGSDDVRYVVPAVNVSENEQGYRIEVAVPGIQKDDFQVEIEDKNLIVKSSKKEETQKKTENYTVREFNYASFYRSFHLPETVDVDSISAQYENGVLHITLPKLQPKIAKVKTIAIQ